MPAPKKKSKKPARTVKTVSVVAPAQSPVATPPQPVISPPQPPQQASEAPVAPQEAPQTEEDIEELLDNQSGESELDRRNSILFVAGIVAALCIILVSVFVYIVYINAPKVSPTIQTKTVVTPMPTPAFAPSSVTFDVLNASGVAGAASKAAKQLSDKGYVVISVGNTQKSAASSLLVSPNLSQPDIIGILSDVGSLFSVSSVSGHLTGSTAAAELIIGVK